MKIEHQHFNKIQSTQIYLKEALEKKKISLELENDFILVSAQRQTNGHGRLGKPWLSNHQSLYLSFTLYPNEVKTLTSLEVAILITKYFHKKQNIAIEIKWPNDLMINHKKCGGIILQNFKNILVVGVGINYKDESLKIENLTFDIPATSLGIELENAKESALELYQFILTNRLNPEEVKKQFKKLCSHKRKICRVHQGEDITEGGFVGIGELGQAIIKTSAQELKEIFNGTLRYEA